MHMPKLLSLITLQCDMSRGTVPMFLVYEHVKVRVPEGRRRDPKILIFGWLRTVVFPDAPVFHALPVSSPQSQYGALDAAPSSVFPEVRPTSLDEKCMGVTNGKSLADICGHQHSTQLAVLSCSINICHACIARRVLTCYAMNSSLPRHSHSL